MLIEEINFQFKNTTGRHHFNVNVFYTMITLSEPLSECNLNSANKIERRGSSLPLKQQRSSKKQTWSPLTGHLREFRLVLPLKFPCGSLPSQKFRLSFDKYTFLVAI